MSNENYNALGFDSEEEFDLFADVGFLDGFRDSPVYRSVSTIDFQEQEVDTVYRSLKVSESCPLEPLMQFEFTEKEPFSACHTSVWNSLPRTQEHEVIDLMPMTRPLNAYLPSAVYTFSDVEAAATLVRRFEGALSEVDMDFRPFEFERSCISCKTVVDGVSFLFDIYFLELMNQDKEEQHANYIIEVQRISSNGCSNAWSSIIDRLMGQVAEVCTGGYYDKLGAPKHMGGLSRSSSVSDAFSAFLEADDDEEEEHQETIFSITNEKALLEQEHAAMLDYACHAKCWSTKMEMAQLLSKLSVHEETAVSLVKMGAVNLLVEALQKDGLLEERGELVRAFYTILGNLALHLSKVNSDITCSFSRVSHAALHAITHGDMTNPFELELLREAARVLGLFAAHAREHQLREKVRIAARKCMASSDKRLSDNASAILRNVTC